MKSKNLQGEMGAFREQVNAFVRRAAEKGVRVQMVDVILSYESPNENIGETTKVTLYVEDRIRPTHDDFGPRVKPDHLIPDVHRF